MSVIKASAAGAEYTTPSPRSRKEEHGGNGSRDIAASFLAKNVAGKRISVTPAESARVLRRIDTVILPIMLTVYFLQGLDKITLEYVSVFGFIGDTKLISDQYSWLGSIVYLAQLVVQPPLAWLLVHLPIAKFTSAMVLLWGVSLTYMAASHNSRSLLATRSFLGVFEASVAPSLQTIRTSHWYAMNRFTNMFGSLITYGLGHISSRLRPYQIMFLFFGNVTVAFGFIMLAFMPDSPVEGKFLSDEDKLIVIERLRMNQMGVVPREWRNGHLKEALLDLNIPSGGISTFGPLIVKTFGFDPFGTILFNIPFGLVQLMAIVGGAIVAQKTKIKGPVIAVPCLPPIVGCVMLISLPRDASHRAPPLAGYYLISGYPGITPLIYSWASQNTAGDTKKKCTNVILFIGESVRNVVSYSKSLRSNLALYVVIIALVGITTIYLKALNTAHTKRQVALWKSVVVIDTNLDPAESIRNVEGGGVAAATSGEDVERLGERAFENLTDLQNEEFIFIF
ncbi:MFS general substrate transporter [Daldinia sp. FL1419]|nr:MFS general substrate transporter [Daldinia sp. FL1419]